MPQTIALVVTLSIITCQVSSLPVQEQLAFLRTVVAKRHPLAPVLTLDSVASDVEAASSTPYEHAIDMQRRPLLMQKSMALQKSQVDAQAFAFWPLIVISATICVCVVLVTILVVATSQTPKALELDKAKVGERLMQTSPQTIVKSSSDSSPKHSVQVPESHAHIGESLALSPSLPGTARENFVASLVVPAGNRLYVAMPDAMSEARQETTFKVTSAHPDRMHDSYPIAQVAVSELKCLHREGPSISLQTLEGGNLGFLSTEGLYNADGGSVLKLMTTFGNEFGSLQNLRISNVYVLTRRGKTALQTVGDISERSMMINDSEGSLAARVSADTRDMLNVEVEPEIDFGLIILLLLGVLKMERRKAANVMGVIQPLAGDGQVASSNKPQALAVDASAGMVGK